MILELVMLLATVISSRENRKVPMFFGRNRFVEPVFDNQHIKE